MKKEETEKLIQFRDYMIKFYSDLGVGWRTTPAAVTPTKQVAVFTESCIKSVDDLLRDYVNFSEKS